VRVLHAFDGSPGALRACELIACLASRGEGAEVSVLNVQPRPLALWPGPGLDPGEVEAALREAGEAAVAPALERLAAAGVRAQAALRLGLPAEAILQEARSWRSEAIVMGTRGKGALQGFALGSVALRVAHGGAAPVLLVKPEDCLPPPAARPLRVLLAMDGSQPALRAAERLAAWRGWLGELDVHVVHVQEPLSLLAKLLPPHEDLLEQWSTRQAQEATRAARELLARSGMQSHLHITEGDAAREIALLAAQTKSDLLVAGTRGRGAAHHALLGSIALKAAVLSPVPLLLVG
jgi:nucleotide-binding universal stress UspA family protein